MNARTAAKNTKKNAIQKNQGKYINATYSITASPLTFATAWIRKVTRKFSFQDRERLGELPGVWEYGFKK